MNVFITGVTGTLGQKLLPVLYESCHSVTGYSRDELKQQQLKRHDLLTLYLGDIRDEGRLVEASRNADIIFHLAALKHVDKLEANPEEAIKTNVIGTMNVLHAQRLNRIPRVVLASTDKACFPVNAYGASKALAERLVMRNPNNVVCRYGNVLGSRGSVLAQFVEDLTTTGSIRITDKRMTRFWITQEDAALFVWLSSLKPNGGLFIPKMKSYSVLKTAILVADILGIMPKQFVEIGIRPGEKLHETLRTEDEGGLMTSNDQQSQFKPKELRDLLCTLVGPKA